MCTLLQSFGVTGFTTVAAVSGAWQEFSDLYRYWEGDIVNMEVEPIFRVGIRTFSGVVDDAHAHHAARYPSRGDALMLLRLARDLGGSQAVAAFHHTPGGKKDIAGQCMELVDQAGDMLQRIQLDAVWPEVSALQRFRAARPHVSLTLAVGYQALADFEHERELHGTGSYDAESLVSYLGRYKGIVDEVVIDRSIVPGGVVRMRSLHGIVRAVIADGNFQIRIAGNLAKETLISLRSLIRENPALGLEAEDGVADENTGVLRIVKVREFLQEVFSIRYMPK